jgi:tetratricopeptide (TPR) repeat protein
MAKKIASSQPRSSQSGGPNPPIPSSDSLKEGIWIWLVDRLGYRIAWGLVVAGLTLGAAVWHWPTIAQSRWGSAAVGWLTRASLPKPVPGYFNVAVVHLVGDASGEQERKIVVALEGVQGVRTSLIDRTIAREGAQLQDAVRRGHDEARAQLVKSGFDAMIWGEVLGSGSDAALRLYWTSQTGVGRASEPFRLTENQTLPTLFWEELKDVLLLVVLATAESLQWEEGGATQQARPFVDRVRSLFSDPLLRGRSAETNVQLHLVFADALKNLGQDGANKEDFAEAIENYNAALSEVKRDENPFLWASIQNSLATVLSISGRDDPGGDQVERALTIFEETLKVRTRDRYPFEWAETKRRIGDSLRRLGERESDNGRLESAAYSYQEALTVLTRDCDPTEWALTQARLGSTLYKLGERETGTARLYEALGAFRLAEGELNRARRPMSWAGLQDNLGTTLQTLGARERSKEHLKEGIASYRRALSEFTRDRAPNEWGATQARLGGALVRLGGLESDPKLVEQGVGSLRNALEVFTREQNPLRWARAQAQLGIALRVLGALTSKAQPLDESVAAFRLALEEIERVSLPIEWAASQNNLGNALAELAEYQPDLTARTQLLYDAAVAYEAALDVFSKSDVSAGYEDTQRNLENVKRLMMEQLGAG